MLARVWFDPAVAQSVRSELPATAVEQDDEDGLVVALTVTNRDGFRSWVLGFLDRAEVLEPPELRESVIAWLDALVTAGGAP